MSNVYIIFFCTFGIGIGSRENEAKNYPALFHSNNSLVVISRCRSQRCKEIVSSMYFLLIGCHLSDSARFGVDKTRKNLV